MGTIFVPNLSPDWFFVVWLAIAMSLQPYKKGDKKVTLIASIVCLHRFCLYLLRSGLIFLVHATIVNFVKPRVCLRNTQTFFLQSWTAYVSIVFFIETTSMSAVLFYFEKSCIVLCEKLYCKWTHQADNCSVVL